MWELGHKKDWALKNWCFWTAVLEKTLESPSECKEIHLVNPEGNQSWIFTGRTDAEAPILWPPDVNSQLIGKDWCWKRLRARGEGAGRGWNKWMASLIQWTRAWANSRRWWRTGKPGRLQSTGSQSRTWLSNQKTATKPALRELKGKLKKGRVFIFSITNTLILLQENVFIKNS